MTTPPPRHRNYLCPVDAPLEVLGGKWKLIIVYHLMERPRRNGELRRLIPPISQKMLTQQLREMEADGIVVRFVADQVPPHVEYSIAEDEQGRLRPLVQAMCDWGVSWMRERGVSLGSTSLDAGLPADDSGYR